MCVPFSPTAELKFRFLLTMTSRDCFLEEVRFPNLQSTDRFAVPLTIVRLFCTVGLCDVFSLFLGRSHTPITWQKTELPRSEIHAVFNHSSLPYSVVQPLL